MKRRTFLAGTAATTASVALNCLPGDSTLKVGVVTSLFKFSGYPTLNLSSPIEYASHKTAYNDLQAGKIDVLISSSSFLIGQKPEFSLFGSLIGDAGKDEWITQNYNYVTAFHAANGLTSTYLGSMSPLMVRISNLDLATLDAWREQPQRISIAASGNRAVWFDHLGFKVREQKNAQRLTTQLAKLSDQKLDVTDAFPPTLFLRGIEINDGLGLPSVFAKGATIVIDNLTKGSVPVEILYRKENEKATLPLQQFLRESINKDIEYQQAALELLLAQTQLPLAPELPSSLIVEINKCRESYLHFLSSYNSAASALVDSFTNFLRV